MHSPYKLSPEQLEQCRRIFDENKEVRHIDIDIARAKECGNWPEVVRLTQLRQRLFDEVAITYEQSISEQVEKLHITEAKIPDADLAEIVHLIVTLFMAIDIQDSCLRDINAILKRTDKSYSFESLKDVQEMNHLVRTQLVHFYNTQKYCQYDCWGDVTDDMYLMMKRKAKAIMNKVDKQNA